MISADDLRVFLEVARRRRLTEAAKHLQINHTTVSRHITRLEQAAGHRLFDRHVDGWSLTEAGTHLIEHAEAIDAALLAAQEECLTAGPSISGRVRVIAPDGFGTYMLLPGLGELRRQHPALVVEIVTANRHESLTPREFDLAVTIERPQARAVDVHKLTDFTLAFYASPEYLAAHSPITTVDDLYDHSLIWYVDDALEHSTFNLLYELLPRAQAQIQTNYIAGHIEAAAAGLGVAFLPTFIGDNSPQVRRLHQIDARVRRSYWMSVPRDLARLARVRLMATFVTKVIAAHKVGSVLTA
ncbi:MULTISPECIES: LysR family transcriptional regulator [Mycolicibacterium]|uniref:LysR family transcriptional regulator n=1 Tax=Mycolicibacterium wolinskyi TaxID=59750 RepID=A0A132PGY7_9MYCO|nr:MULTISPECIES: LysR family transcriptional regulator [Mycolicibacterium]KWX21605.1 LysR family transcriptional regulator [Mycolicibacterium wolinskyi]MCV7285724.1 LysR family transcriptional regulator [Mycolicibacterium wolinskyi]MCV7291245.1 LysR family transcriptional regulator [Mycolicibacterium goodii]ORX15640.1 LysR family transcriptional regulator [Mycolicibacterium wolinskyi]